MGVAGEQLQKWAEWDSSKQPFISAEITTMPAPSQLSIATSVVNRLVKEEASYHTELEQQKVRISKLEANNGDEYELRQEVRTARQSLYLALSHEITEASIGGNLRGAEGLHSQSQLINNKTLAHNDNFWEIEHWLHLHNCRGDSTT